MGNRLSIEFRTLRRLALGAFWVMCFAFAIDLQHGAFNGACADHLLLLSLLLFFGAGIPLLVFGWRHLLVKPGGYLFIGWGVFLLYAALVSLPQEGVPKVLFFRVSLVFVMCWFGMGAVLVLAGLGYTLRQVFVPILAGAFFAALWRFFTGFQTEGASLENIRLQILGPSLMFLFAYGAGGLVLGRKLRVAAALSILAAFAISFISITRWLLVDAFAAFAASGFLLLLLVFWRGLRVRDLGIKAAQGIVAGALMVAAITAFMLANPVTLERWEKRMTQAFDAQTSKPLTLLTREAEAAGMYEELDAKPWGWALGRGIAGRFSWPTEYYPELLSVIDDPKFSNFSADRHFLGHSMWRYAVFSTGFVGLLFYIGLFLMAGFTSLRAAYLASRRGARDSELPYELVLLPLVFLCVIGVDSLTSNAFAERYQAALIGMMAVFPQLAYNALRPRPQQPVPAPVPHAAPPMPQVAIMPAPQLRPEAPSPPGGSPADRYAVDTMPVHHSPDQPHNGGPPTP